MSSLLIFQMRGNDDCNIARVQGEDVFPIPGTKRIHYLEENMAAFHIKLTAKDKQQLEAVFAADQVTSYMVISFSVALHQAVYL